jgi:hypothetical protein
LITVFSFIKSILASSVYWPNYCQQALKSFPNDLILLKNAGAFAGRIGNVSLLEEYMLKILEINPSDVVVHL